jgi:hypothetical protein
MSFFGLPPEATKACSTPATNTGIGLTGDNLDGIGPFSITG